MNATKTKIETLCHICGKDPGTKENKNLWKGFFDRDTKEYVCWDCQEEHYKIKILTQFAGKYSEVQVIIDKN